MNVVEREEMINDSLPLINHIAHRVAMRLPPSVEICDLVNAGVIGLLDAVEKFEPERGFKFKTYAELRIRGAILDSLRDLDWAPRSLRKKSKDLEKVYRVLGQRLGRPATDEEVCLELGEDIEDFHALVDQLHGLTIGSFEDIGDNREDGSGESFINYYPDDGENDPYEQFERGELGKMLGGVIDSLPEREACPVTLLLRRVHDEGDRCDVGCERVARVADSHQGHAPPPLQNEKNIARCRIGIPTSE